MDTIDPGTLTLSRFQALMDDEFTIEAEGVPAQALRLVTAEVHREGNEHCFSLVFRGEAGAHLPQGIYRFTHAALGAVDLFAVPIGPDGEGRCRYEVVFNTTT